MRIFENLSIKNKLIGIIFLVSMLAIVLGFTVIIIKDIISFKTNMVDNTTINARLIGEYCVTPLAFQDNAGAEEILGKLEAISSVMNGYVYDDKGDLFAVFNRSEEMNVPPLPTEEETSSVFEGKYLHLFQPIIYQTQKYGTIYLRASTDLLIDKIKRYLLTMVLFMMGLMVLSYLLAYKLQGIISNPILKLADVTKKISEDGDYSIRVEKREGHRKGNDEINILYSRFDNMLEQIHFAEDELIEAKEFAQNIIDSSLDMIVVVDKDRRIVKFNFAAQETFGYSEEEILGKQVRILYANEEEGQKVSNMVLREGKYVGELYNIRKNGETFPSFLSASIMRDKNGEIIGTVGNSRDITELKRAEEELRRHREHLEELVEERTIELGKKTKQIEQANIKLKELDRLKSMFIASMSHELRTPLNSIIGFTGILLMGVAGEITEEQSKQLTMVKNSANHLLALINDIIDVSKIEADKVELLIEEFDLSTIVQEVKDSFTVAVDNKGLKMPLNMPGKLVIKSDERRVKQIIMNLAGNAVKFTDEGEIEIKVSKKDEMVELSVRDTGFGMRKEDLDKLFKAFSRILVEDRTVEGTGLGLYLSKKIANLLGGDILAESEFRKGSMFTFTLPLKYKEV